MAIVGVGEVKGEWAEVLDVPCGLCGCALSFSSEVLDLLGK